MLAKINALLTNTIRTWVIWWSGDDGSGKNDSEGEGEESVRTRARVTMNINIRTRVRWGPGRR